MTHHKYLHQAVPLGLLEHGKVSHVMLQKCTLNLEETGLQSEKLTRKEESSKWAHWWVQDPMRTVMICVSVTLAECFPIPVPLHRWLSKPRMFSPLSESSSVGWKEDAFGVRLTRALNCPSPLYKLYNSWQASRWLWAQIFVWEAGIITLYLAHSAVLQPKYM